MNQHAFSMHVVLMDAYFNSVDVLQHFSDFFAHSSCYLEIFVNNFGAVYPSNRCCLYVKIQYFFMSVIIHIAEMCGVVKCVISTVEINCKVMGT